MRYDQLYHDDVLSGPLPQAFISAVNSDPMLSAYKLYGPDLWVGPLCALSVFQSKSLLYGAFCMGAQAA